MTSIAEPGELFAYDMWNYFDIQRYVIKEIGTVSIIMSKVK